MKLVKLLSVALILICICCGCGSDEKGMMLTVITNEGETISISPEKLTEECESQEAKFNKQFYGAPIVFSGTIEKISLNGSALYAPHSVKGGYHKVVFEEGLCLVIDEENTEIDLADFEIGEVVQVSSSIISAPEFTDYLKEITDTDIIFVWVGGDDVIEGGNAKTVISKTSE